MEIVSGRHFPKSAQGNVLFNTFIGFQGIKQDEISNDGSGIQCRGKLSVEFQSSFRTGWLFLYLFLPLSLENDERNIEGNCKPAYLHYHLIFITEWANKLT
ncbi:MAG TPA: hypothetical protein VIQ51_03465 [Chryseosolibacter sp.]